jgi:hypothetical protein
MEVGRLGASPQIRRTFQLLTKNSDKFRRLAHPASLLGGILVVRLITMILFKPD